MKLVNVEDLKVLVAVESKGEIRYGKLVTDLFEDIPTVNAIPVEWLRKWNIDNYPYTALLMSEIIPKMIADWEKENEKS